MVCIYFISGPSKGMVVRTPHAFAKTCIEAGIAHYIRKTEWKLTGRNYR